MKCYARTSSFLWKSWDMIGAVRMLFSVNCIFFVGGGVLWALLNLNDTTTQLGGLRASGLGLQMALFGCDGVRCRWGWGGQRQGEAAAQRVLRAAWRFACSLSLFFLWLFSSSHHWPIHCLCVYLFSPFFIRMNWCAYKVSLFFSPDFMDELMVLVIWFIQST